MELHNIEKKYVNDDGWFFKVTENYIGNRPVYTVKNETMNDCGTYTDNGLQGQDGCKTTFVFKTDQLPMSISCDGGEAVSANELKLSVHGSFESASFNEFLSVVGEKLRLERSFSAEIASRLAVRLAEAEKKHPVFAEGVYEALGRVSEEVGELVRAVNHNEGESRIMSEAYDTLAVLVRFIRGDWRWNNEDK